MIIVGIISLKMINVSAESATFYEAEYIDNIYMSKYQYSNNTIYYQKARFFRKSDTQEAAYCIEPFTFFNENSVYESTLNPYNLSQEQKTRIERIAHFGYGYKNHTDVKWYAITQMMIWETADPNSGTFFFTDYLNGNKIYPYQDEMNEINYLVNTYDIIPSINNQTYNIVEGQDFYKSSEEIMKFYSSNDNRVNLSYGDIKISNLSEGEYDFTLYRNDNNYNNPVIFYQSYNSQNLLKTGNLENKEASFKVIVKKTEINVTKLDKDTQDTSPQGEAILDGATINVLDLKKNIIRTIEIKDNIGKTTNLPYGTYYLQEIEAGEGYNINNDLYEVNITTDNPKPQINIYNKVIEKKVTISKKYGEDDNLNPEKNIDFEIYDINNKLIKTVSTNDEGIVSFNLPYGKYKIVQKNSTNGYKKVDPFTITVDKDDEETIELKDYKIPVPNTHTTKRINIIYIIITLLLL